MWSSMKHSMNTLLPTRVRVGVTAIGKVAAGCQGGLTRELAAPGALAQQLATQEDEAVAVAQLRARRCDIAMRRHVGLAARAAHDVAGVEHRLPAPKMKSTYCR